MNNKMNCNKLFLMVALICCTTNSSAQNVTVVDPYLPDTNPIKVIPGYSYVWGDEFNTDGSVDTILWDGEKGFIRGHEQQYYQMKNATVSNGRLIILGRKERVYNEFYDPHSSDYRKNTQYANYTSASLLGRNKRYFLYGRIEVRARIDSTCGTFPAIWTCGYNKNWPQNGEIDIMEYYPVKYNGVYEPVLTSNFAVGGDTSGSDGEWASKWKSVFTKQSYYENNTGDKNWINKYHIFRMDWDEDSIKLYVDDNLRNSCDISSFKNFDGSVAFNNPQYMMLNLALKDNGMGLHITESHPATFEVDYFRVYQKIIDEEKPSPVSDLMVENVSATTCKLQWHHSEDNKGVYRYDIYKNGMADGYYVKSTNDTTALINGLIPNTNMYFVVRALDSVGNYSDIKSNLKVMTTDIAPLADKQIYYIINNNSGKVLSPLNSSLNSGTNLVQTTCNNDDIQKWQLIKSDDTYWGIKNVSSGFYMDINGASTNDGAKNIQWTYTGDDNQLWTFVKNGNFYNIVNKKSGKYLDISDASQTENWQCIQWKANGGKNQMWEMAETKTNTTDIMKNELKENIYIKNLKSLIIIDSEYPTKYLIYSEVGTLISSGEVNSGRTTVPIRSGFYIIKIGSRIFKIIH